MRVGIVGTGEMGRPLVGRLLGAGFEVSAFARRDDARDELARAGVRSVDRVDELGARNDVVIVYVYSDDQVRDVVLEQGLADAMAPGSVVVVKTTGSPSTVGAIRDRVGARQVGVVDAPGSGGPAQVADGTLTVFVGGDDADVERCRPVFDSYASHVVHFGALGAGQTVKLLNNLLFGAHVELALEVARLSEELGVDPALLATTLHTCSGASYALDLVAAMGSADTVVQAAGRFVHKDVVVAEAVAAELGVSLGSLGAVTTPLLERTRPR
jgi:3-hydroxyisobutyrate dehydrogenase-like beta-hydroxyacid dehydrogenase